MLSAARLDCTNRKRESRRGTLVTTVLSTEHTCVHKKSVLGLFLLSSNHVLSLSWVLLMRGQTGENNKWATGGVAEVLMTLNLSPLIHRSRGFSSGTSFIAEESTVSLQKHLLTLLFATHKPARANLVTQPQPVRATTLTVREDAETLKH